MAKKSIITLQDRIQSLQPYFLSIEVKESLYIVKVLLPNKWSAYNREDEVIKVVKSDTDKNTWFYYAEIKDVELNDIFDLIEETIATNESVTKKIALMKTKMEELKDLFQNESLERLETLEFMFKNVKKTKVKSAEKKTKRASSKLVDVPYKQVESSKDEIDVEDITRGRLVESHIEIKDDPTIIYGSDIDNIDL